MTVIWKYSILPGHTVDGRNSAPPGMEVSSGRNYRPQPVSRISSINSMDCHDSCCDLALTLGKASTWQSMEGPKDGVGVAVVATGQTIVLLSGT